MKKKLPKSVRKFIRREKARIRRDVFDIKEQKRLIDELYERFMPKEGKAEVKESAPKKEKAEAKKAVPKKGEKKTEEKPKKKVIKTKTEKKAKPKEKETPKEIPKKEAIKG